MPKSLPEYEITGYRQSGDEERVTQFPISRDDATSIASTAGILASHDGLGSYPLDKGKLAAVVKILGGKFQPEEDLDYFLEPCGPNKHRFTENVRSR